MSTPRNKLFDLELDVQATRAQATPGGAKPTAPAGETPLGVASACYDAGTPIQLTYSQGLYQSASSFSMPDAYSATDATVYPEEALSYQVESFDDGGNNPEDEPTDGESATYGQSSSAGYDASAYQTSAPAWTWSESASEAPSSPGGAPAAPPRAPTDAAPADADADEFLKELQSIMKGETAYDPQTKAARPTAEAPASAPAPAPPSPPAPPVQLASGHSIFDQIAANMSTAQAFNLGAYDLEKSLTIIEETFEKQQAKAALRPAYVQPLSAIEIAEYLAEANETIPAEPEQMPLDDDSVAYATAETATVSAFTAPAPPPVTQAFLDAIAGQTFAGGAQVNAYFQGRFQQDFLTWFHDHAGNQQHWAGRNCLTNADTQRHFATVWDNVPTIYGRASINLMEFLSLASIIINETGGTFVPIAERVNGPSHPVAPGIAYAYNAIPNLKASYNTLSSNKTAFDLFNTADFLTAHASRPLIDRVRNTTDGRWRGTRYPCAYTDAERQSPPPGGFFPVSPDPAQSGIILETDFYKFRGRGLIQTTSRGNYRPIIQFIQAYAGPQPVLHEYARDWHGLSPDTVATTSTNGNWDTLFQQTDSIIPAVGIALHSAAPGNNYLTMPLTVASLNGSGTGSVYHMGRRISGGAAYASLFKNRVLQLVSLLA